MFKPWKGERKGGGLVWGLKLKSLMEQLNMSIPTMGHEVG
jgi:hypothetical protein